MAETESVKTTLPVPALEFEWQGYTCCVYEEIDRIAEAWDSVNQEQDLFLSTRYFKGVELYPPLGMSFYYALISKDGLVGAVYMQLSHFNAHNSLNYERANGEDPAGIGRSIKEFVAKKIDFYTLVCGNTLVTGMHGYRFAGEIDQNTQLLIIDQVLDRVKAYAIDRGLNVRLTFIKDFFERVFSQLPARSTCQQYNEFSAQPNMIMPIDPAWDSYQDYVDALQSKYRVRVKRARKKFKGVERRDLDVDALRREFEIMHLFYREIADKASFNLFILDPRYMIGVKQMMGDDFRVIGYYAGGELIAYYSLLLNGSVLDAHFLGYEASVNRAKQIYLNMLLDMISIAIEERCTNIVFARTAMEIKSSVGAEAHQMYFYLQHNQSFKNVLLPYFYNLLDPKTEWVPRNPFREEN